MILGEMKIERDEDEIIENKINIDEMRMRKGKVIERRDIDEMRKEGIDRVIEERIERGDIGEEEEEIEIGRMIEGKGIEKGNEKIGRVNIFD